MRPVKIGAIEALRAETPSDNNDLGNLIHLIRYIDSLHIPAAIIDADMSSLLSERHAG